MASFAPTWKIVLLASIQVAVEFASTVKGALITPSAKKLWLMDISSVLLIWISGPVCEILIPLIVGFCNKWLGRSRWWRNKPIIAIGCLVQIFGMVVISLTWDVAQVGKHSWELSPRTFSTIRNMFVGGCWIMEISKNFILGSASNLMLDVCQNEQRQIKESERWIIVFKTLGSIAGSAASSYSHLHKGFPFTRTSYCDAACANLKSCYIVNMVLFGVTMCVLLKYISQPPSPEQHETSEDEGHVSILTQSKQAMKKPFLHLYIAYTLAMVAWYPFDVFAGDYIGRYIYGGDVESPLYMEGVRVAALGLMLLAVVVAVVSLALEPLKKSLGGLKKAWGMSTILLACTFVGSIVLKDKAEQARSNAVSLTRPPKQIMFATLAFYLVMGIPSAATSLLPSWLVSVYADDIAPNSGGVKNLAAAVLKVLNLLSDILAVSLGVAFGSDYLMFIVSAIAAVLSSIVIFTRLPSSNA